MPGTVRGAGDIRQRRCGTWLRGIHVLLEIGGHANQRGERVNQQPVGAGEQVNWIGEPNQRGSRLTREVLLTQIWLVLRITSVVL